MADADSAMAAGKFEAAETAAKTAEDLARRHRLLWAERQRRAADTVKTATTNTKP
jgi:hypothetical protein